MFHRMLTECFPYDDLPALYECVSADCFYHETLLKRDEVNWKHKWNGESLPLLPFCPACSKQMTQYEDPDGKKEI